MNSLLLLLSASSTLAPSPAALLDRVRDQIQTGAPAWQYTRMEGSARIFGEAGTYQFDCSDKGQFRTSVEGPISESYGFNGKQYWQVDRTGWPRLLDFEDADRWRGLQLLLTSDWLNPSAATVTVAGNEFHIRPAGSQVSETLVIDPATNLPKEARMESSAGTVTIKLQDWRAAGARKVPTRIDITEAGATDHYEIDTLQQETSIDRCDPPTEHPTDFHFNSNEKRELEVKRAVTGHLLVHPRVNGKDVGWFILDSGADIMIVDRSTADALKLPKVGEEPLVGIGGAVMGHFRPVKEFRLGPLTMSGIKFAEFDLSQFKDIMGEKLGGIIGTDLFLRSIVSVDFAKETVSLIDPAKFASKGGWTPLRFDNGNPAVEATMEGNRRAWYRIDTGASGALALHGPYVRKEKLLAHRATRAGGAGGVGGTAEMKIGTVDWFELASHRFDHPSVMFSEATEGAFADQYLAGNIGQDLLLPFRVSFDFGHSRVMLSEKKP